MPSKQHRDYLQKAILLAADNVGSGLGGPYGAVIVLDNQIIAASANRVTSSNDPTAHAEIVAIRSACQTRNNFQLADCILYSSCEPCPMCLGAIYWARLKQVYFACNREDAANAGFDDSFIYNEIPLKPAARKIPMHQLDLDDQLLPFNKWKQFSQKVLY